MTPVGILAVTGVWGATVFVAALLLAGCQQPISASGTAETKMDPWVHSEEAPLAEFCQKSPGHGTCPR